MGSGGGATSGPEYMPTASSFSLWTDTQKKTSARVNKIAPKSKVNVQTHSLHEIRRLGEHANQELALLIRVKRRRHN